MNMKNIIVCIVSVIVVLPINTFAFDFIRELLFPRFPMVNRVKDIDESRGFGDDLAVLDTAGLVRKYGYPAEEHNITTEDGFNIIFFRVPGSPESPEKNGKPVVLIQHGMLASSDSWVLLGPKHDLVYLLADNGYDVWISNVRGNSYGRTHTDLSPQDPEFWNFSFHEMGIWDLPKMIDHALEISGEKSLIYIGHSMGTTMAYVLLSEKPEYNEKFRVFINLAPVAFWKQPPNLIFRISRSNGELIKKFLDDNGIYEFGSQNANNFRFGRALCSDTSLTQPACISLIFLIAGNDPFQFNSTLLPLITAYFPAGASVTTLYHYQQNIVSGAFQKYDYGYTENFKIYGKKKPPIYDVKKIVAPIALIYGKNDFLSVESNSFELVKKLRNVVTFEAVPYDSFNHFDFLWAKDARELIFNRIIDLMSMYPQQLKN